MAAGPLLDQHPVRPVSLVSPFRLIPQFGEFTLGAPRLKQDAAVSCPLDVETILLLQGICVRKDSPGCSSRVGVFLAFLESRIVDLDDVLDFRQFLFPFAPPVREQNGSAFGSWHLLVLPGPASDPR